jgi:hypothetical protein
MLAAYRDFATLEEHCDRRGVEALEADLLAALDSQKVGNTAGAGAGAVLVQQQESTA